MCLQEGLLGRITGSELQCPQWSSLCRKAKDSVAAQPKETEAEEQEGPRSQMSLQQTSAESWAWYSQVRTSPQVQLLKQIELLYSYSLPFFPFHRLGLQTHWMLPQSRWVLPLWWLVHTSVISGNTSQTHPEVCFTNIDISESSHVNTSHWLSHLGGQDDIELHSHFITYASFHFDVHIGTSIFYRVNIISKEGKKRGMHILAVVPKLDNWWLRWLFHFFEFPTFFYVNKY